MADEGVLPSAETEDDFGLGPEGKVRRWLAEIKSYETEFRSWLERCPKIIQRYRDETPGGEIMQREHGRFNILWSNIQTLQPALYSRLPKAEVRRRYKDQDPIGRAAAEILERSLSWSIDTYDFNGTIKSVRDDYLLTARGQAWVRYVPHKGDEIQDRIQLTLDDTGNYRDEDGTVFEEFQEDDKGVFAQSEPYKPVDYEEVSCDHINWEDFGHSPAPSWAKVGAVWKRELLTRNQLVERFGDVGKEVALSKTVKGVSADVKESFGDTFGRAEVYEIWDKDSMKAIWISPGYVEEPLDELDDPLGLDEFFPCPQPLYGTITTDKLVPVPDYAEYQSQAQELDRLTERIQVLTQALKVTGFYAGDKTDEIESALRGADNIMIPVANWAMVSERGGMQNLVAWFPIEQVSTVLQGLVQMREQVKRDLYELTGLSDIIRGQGAQQAATATEQRIKGQYAALRLDDRKLDVARFVRDILRIKAEIISEHFDISTIAEMSGWQHSPEAQALDQAHQEAMGQNEQAQQMMMAIQTGQILPEQAQQMPQPQMVPVPPSAQMVFDEAVKLLKDDRLRTFRIDIEADSTVLVDEEAEKTARVEFMQGIAAFLKEAIPAVQAEPAIAPILGEMLLFTVRGWKTGRQMEAVLEQSLDQLKMNAKQPEGPSPEEMEAQKQQEEMKMKAQTEQARAAADQAKAAVDQQKLQIEGQKLTIEQQSAQAEAEFRQAEAMASENDRQRAHEIRLRELTLRETEVETRLDEIKLQPVREDRKFSLDREKLLIEREKHDKELMAKKEERTENRQGEVEDRDFMAGEAKGSLDKQMAKVSESLLATAAQTVGKKAEEADKKQDAVMKQMDENHQALLKTIVAALTAPKVIERDASGKVTGAKVEMDKGTLQ